MNKSKLSNKKLKVDTSNKKECWCKDYNKVLAFSKEKDITLAEAIKKICNGCSE